MQGRVRLRPEVWKLLWHLVERWHELVRSQGNPKVPASTNRLEGWFGRFKPRARLTRGLKTEAGADGPQHGLKRRMQPAGVENRPMTAVTNINEIETVLARLLPKLAWGRGQSADTGSLLGIPAT